MKHFTFTKTGRTLLTLTAAVAGLMLMSSCMSPLEKAAWKKSYGFSEAEVIQPPSEGETVVDTVDWYYTESRTCSGKRPPSVSIYGETRCHATGFGAWMAARISLRRYAEKFPNTGIDEVKDLYVRSVKQTGTTRFSGNETVGTSTSGKSEPQFEATTTFSFQALIVKRNPPAPGAGSVGAAGQGR